MSSEQYRVEWVDNKAQKRYKFYDDYNKAMKAEQWLIKSGALDVYTVAIIYSDEIESQQERDAKFGIK